MVMAKITGLKPAKAFHKVVNVHIYEDQIDLLKEQIKRLPFYPPTLMINENIKTLEDLETWVSTEHFHLKDYRHHPHIKFPFSV
jgi:thymidylate synthase